MYIGDSPVSCTRIFQIIWRVSLIRGFNIRSVKKFFYSDETFASRLALYTELVNVGQLRTCLRKGNTFAKKTSRIFGWVKLRSPNTLLKQSHACAIIWNILPPYCSVRSPTSINSSMYVQCSRPHTGLPFLLQFQGVPDLSPRTRKYVSPENTWYMQSPHADKCMTWKFVRRSILLL